jgi:hypothetical protein
MTYRITQRDLEGLCTTLNRVTGNPQEAYTEVEGVYKSNPGCYIISCAYGGVQLQQICNDGGGVRTPIGGGYSAKRDLYYRMHAFLDGLCTRKEA